MQAELKGVTLSPLRRLVREELMTARKEIFPYLQAEQDGRYQAARQNWEAWEADVMSDVAGWEVGKCVYRTREWMPPMPKFGAAQYVFD
jgi:GRIM-19 protein